MTVKLDRKNFIGASAAALTVTALPAEARDSAPKELLVHGGTIHTVDPASPKAEAFVVRDGRFAFVGSLRAARAFASSGAVELNLSGKTVLPGLIDAHVHLQSVGLALHEVQLHGVSTFDDVVRRTVAFAQASPDTWIVGEGWDQNLWPGKAFPVHDELSARIPDRPVVLYRVDGHALLANAKALQLAGVAKASADPDGGRIIRKEDGSPTGVLVDNAMRLIARVIPEPSREQLVRATLAAIEECHRYGLTSVADARTGAANLAVYEELAHTGRLDLRVYAMLDGDDKDLLAARFADGPRIALHDGLLWIHSVKMFADGALGSRGAALLAPYSDDPKNTGLLRLSEAHVRDVCERALRAGFQVCTHAIGDRGNRMVLDAYEAALKTVPLDDHRLRVEHAQVLSAPDIPRFAELGVIPSMQTTHQISDMGWAQARLGPERVKGAYAWRSLLKTGVIIPNGTDAPVEEVSTLRTFHSAVSRQNESNEPAGGWYPAQRMTRDEALKSMTIWAARANFQEHVLGSITPGKYADFVVMDRDWMSVASKAIMQTRILATYFGGRRVYDAEHHAAASVSLQARGERGCDCSAPES